MKANYVRKTIRAIAGTPGLQKIHLLAHSRGTDVLATAVSELSVEAYTQRSNIAQRYKIGNVVLLAPDLDPDVAVVAEGDSDGLADGLTDGLALGLTLGLALGLTDGLALVEADGDADGEAEGDSAGLPDALGT